MRKIAVLLLKMFAPVPVVAALLIAGALQLGRGLPSDALLFMTEPNQFVLHEWPHDIRLSYNTDMGMRQRIVNFQWMPDGRGFIYNRDYDGVFISYLYDIFSKTNLPLGMDTPDNRLPIFTSATQRWAWPTDDELLCIKSQPDEQTTCNNFEGMQSLTWSPDGQSLAFFEDRRSRLQVLNVINGEATMLETGTEPLNAVPLTWTPDSRSLAFMQTISPSLSNRATAPINTLIEFHQVEGQWQPPVRTTIAQQYPSDIAYTIDHTWSPDGRQFAFSAVQSIREQNLNELYIFHRDTATMQQLTMNFSQEIHPRWSTDSAWLAYLENANGFPYMVVRSSASGYEDSQVFPIYGFNLDWRP
jgi:Tol biopolymer transport system component